MDQIFVFGGGALGLIALYQKSLMAKNQDLIDGVTGYFGTNRAGGFIPVENQLPQSYEGRVSIPYKETYDMIRNNGTLDHYIEMDDYYRTVAPTRHFAFNPYMVKERKQYPEQTEIV